MKMLRKQMKRSINIDTFEEIEDIIDIELRKNEESVRVDINDLKNDAY